MSSYLFHSLDFHHSVVQQFFHLCSPQRAYVFLSKKEGKRKFACRCLWPLVLVSSHSASIGDSLTHLLGYQFL